MSRPVRRRSSYTGDRSKLSSLELAIEKDQRLSDAEKQAVSTQIRKLVALFIELDSKYAPPDGREREVVARR